MALLDLRAWARRVDDREGRFVLHAAHNRMAEAYLLLDELLAHGEQETVAMLTAALQQFRLASAS
ncbi:MAG TPA: hypothetical protein VF245_12160 [Solirubrobacterales bacterium]